jgi:hypothetical protein
MAVGLALIAVVGWRLLSARPPRADATVAAAPAVAQPVKVPTQSALAARGPVNATPPVKMAILRSASRVEVLAYAHDLLAGGGPLENIVALLEFLVSDRPELAVDLAREIGRTDGERQVLLYATLSAWADKDASAALRWAFQHSDAYAIPGRASLLYIVLEQIAADDPSAALVATETNLRLQDDAAAANSRADIVRFTFEALIKHGHADLAQRALERWSLGSEVVQLNATDFGIVAMALARDSYGNAGTWLQSLPSSSARNEAYLPFAAAWAREDAATAMDWAQGLNPADGGDDVRVATFAGWLKSDRTAATRWLIAHNSPDSTRLRSLLNPEGD